jgi:hypothetical protein
MYYAQTFLKAFVLQTVNADKNNTQKSLKWCSDWGEDSDGAGMSTQIYLFLDYHTLEYWSNGFWWYNKHWSKHFFLKTP